MALRVSAMTASILAGAYRAHEGMFSRDAAAVLTMSSAADDQTALGFTCRSLLVLRSGNGVPHPVSITVADRRRTDVNP